MRHARKTDSNHAAIRDGLRQLGWRVRDYSGVGDGVPDICVMIYFGVSMFLEIKDPSKDPSARKLTDAEKEWANYNGWNTRTVLTLEEAHAALLTFREEVKCMMSQRAVSKT